MARIGRIVIQGEDAVYHVMSHTALDGFVLGDIEKEELLRIIKRFSSIFFAEVMGFSIMGNHFHLLVKMKTSDGYSDKDIKERFHQFYGKDQKKRITDGQIPYFRGKWESLSEYIKEIKQSFSRFYNKKNGRRGFFWSDRFKSVLVENGDTLINCLAYIDLNPVRAGIVKRPEEYRWCSLGYHVQSVNKDDFLSLDFGLRELIHLKAEKRLEFYREFVYEKGGLGSGKGQEIDPELLEGERKQSFKISQLDRFKYRTRYFADSAIIGSKSFVSKHYHQFKDNFHSIHEKKPRPISGLKGIYSLKRLSEFG